MATASVVLISEDGSLPEAVRRAAGTLASLCVETVAGVEEVLRRLPTLQAPLLLPHLTAAADAGGVVDLLRAVASAKQPVATVVLSDRSRPQDALRLLRLGAADYLERPLDLQRLAYLMDVLTLRARFRAEKAPERPAAVSLTEHDSFLYAPSAAMQRLMGQVQRIAPLDTTVLLTGETGTGKTRLARLIHELSPRRGQPFVTVNCGALSANLLESELFGHVKGAFTGAVRDRAGKIAEAGRGTLLLDDIDALPVELQAKLLRVVEEHTFEPVGSNQHLRMESRLIVASNRVLEDEVAAGRLRSDLYYRLNVVGFYIPPLRERRELIAPLAGQLLAEFAARNGRAEPALSPGALRALQGYDWPGNIRELRNVLERASALCPGPEVQCEDFPEALQAAGAAAGAAAAVPAPAGALPRPTPPEDSATLAATREEAEAHRIANALQRHNNNRVRVAAELGISRMTLYKKLHRYGFMGASG
jgi:DNA-binding NtrC family response regulator